MNLDGVIGQNRGEEKSMRLIDADHLKSWILSRVFKTQLNLADVIDQIDRKTQSSQGARRGNGTLSVTICLNVLVAALHTRRNSLTVSKNHTNDKRFPRFCPNCGEKMEGSE